jgi:hypothetical protein
LPAVVRGSSVVHHSQEAVGAFGADHGDDRAGQLQHLRLDPARREQPQKLKGEEGEQC